MTTPAAAPLLERVAAAPISWGVCEVPGWGHQLPVARVLEEMHELGFTATEFGPDGFLPEDPAARAATLRAHGLAAVGGFVPAVLHDPANDPLPALATALDAFVACGADTLVLAAATGRDGYEGRPDLDTAGWKTLLANLDHLAALAHARGITATLHPHIGTMVEHEPEVLRVLDGAGIALCLDTGHLLAGGTDPLALARRAADRIAHVHLKDVDTTAADQVRAGRTSYADAVARGMYRPLGHGDLDVPALVRTLEAGGYRGWYVLEQDTVLHADPAPGQGPARDVRTGLDLLAALATGPGGTVAP
ncbi:inosose dehydratase [Streptacidiphilus sp. MAP12-16]|uniref:TIM barrel protein n=1 Tax=Streptacidiphilus sp. MAP12-16 TaxID=3156300 RepID=UPI003511BA8A